MDYENIIHRLIDSIVEDPKSVLIRVSEGTTSKDVLIIIAAEKNDTARLIGHTFILNSNPLKRKKWGPNPPFFVYGIFKSRKN